MRRCQASSKLSVEDRDRTAAFNPPCSHSGFIKWRHTVVRDTKFKTADTAVFLPHINKICSKLQPVCDFIRSFANNYFGDGGIFGVGSDDLANGIGDDLARQRILHGEDVANYVRVYCAILEGEVTAFHRAIDEGEVLAIAKRLSARNAAIDEREPVGIPADVFPVEHAILDGGVVGMPKGVLRFEDGRRHVHVARILEGIFPAEDARGHRDVAALKKGVLGRDVALLHSYPFRAPAELGRIDAAIFEGDVLALAYGFDPVHLAALNRDGLVIPKRRAATLGHLAADDLEAGVVPKRIAQIHEAILDDDVLALLQKRLAILDALEAAIRHEQIFGVVERSLR